MSSESVVETKDVVEDVLELIEEKASWVIRNPRVLILSALVTGVVIGSAATYLSVRNRFATKYRREADTTIADVKEHYALLRKDGAKGNLAELAAKYTVEEREAVDEIIKTEGYQSYDRVASVSTLPVNPIAMVIESEIVHHNVFESDDPDRYFDYKEELQRRADHPDLPHVISKDEFDQGEADYDQSTLTFYDGDDVLADAQDGVVDDVDTVVGYANLLRFGHGSGDPNVVYIRNPKLELDFEMTQSPGNFVKEVLGLSVGESELQHSHKRPQRRFRTYDE